MPFPNVFYSSEMENLKKLYPDYLERTFENNQVALFPTIPALQYDNGMFRYEFVDITEKEVVNFERFVQIRDHEIDTHPVMGYALLYISLDLPQWNRNSEISIWGEWCF
jgi:glutaredoxin-related protein